MLTLPSRGSPRLQPWGGIGTRVWNKTLADRQRRYTLEQKSTSYKETDAALSAWKKTQELAFLSEVSSVPLQQTLRHQHAAFAAFFTGTAKYPRFKNRHVRQSAHFTRSAFRIKDGALWLAKTTAPLQVAWSWPDVDLADLDPTMVIVSREPDGRWFVSFAVEDLNVSGMVRNRRLAKSISEASWGEFRSMLEYKAERACRRVTVINRWYPSSKTCSACGHLLAQLSLGTRQWTCPDCGTRHDRDINAAKNVLVAAGLVETQNACGGDVRPVGASRRQSPAKQELPQVTTGNPHL